MNALRERRLKGAILTQSEVAKKLGVGVAAVNKWEHGLSKPRVDRLPAIAKLYGCTVDELLADVNDSKVVQEE